MNPLAILLSAGDQAPAQSWQLLDVDDDPVALDPQARVTFNLVPSSGGAPVFSVVCAVVDAATGKVRIDWPVAAAQLAAGSKFFGQFVVRQSSLEATYPPGGSVLVRVAPRLTVETLLLDLEPRDLAVQVGQTRGQALQAYLITNGGAPEYVTDQVAWSGALNPPLLSVSSDGSVTGLAAGTATVTATLGSVTASVQVVVTP